MFYLTMHSTHFIYGYMAWDHQNSAVNVTMQCVTTKGDVVATKALNSYGLEAKGESSPSSS